MVAETAGVLASNRTQTAHGFDPFQDANQKDLYQELALS